MYLKNNLIEFTPFVTGFFYGLKNPSKGKGYQINRDQRLRDVKM